ncbi:MAG TPA: nucleotidyltransferase domain-containing protein [Anaerolineales bacterium]|nr:nucleotidyltransferase domain-containing protein [Anaerolineales bacterium]
MLVAIQVQTDQIWAFCERWKIIEFSLFGSVLRDDFSSSSDLDILIDFSPDARWGLFDLVDMKQELEDLTGRDVDLLTRGGLNASQNWIRKDEILRTVRPVDLSEN